MSNQPKKYDDDDGRVICSMDVEGTRWHDKAVRREAKVNHKVAQGDQLTRSEARIFTWYAVLAGLFNCFCFFHYLGVVHFILHQSLVPLIS